MEKYTYTEAKKVIRAICEHARNGKYDTREKFTAMLDKNPSIACQGYNAFGKIFFWNRASCHVYGYSERAAVNTDIFELVLPPELRPFARDMTQLARQTGKIAEASSCDLIQSNGEYVTVFSGHLVFQWDEGTEPEFYCVDAAIDPISA